MSKKNKYTEYQIGESVEFGHKLERKELSYTNYCQKIWQSVKLDEPLQGLIVGAKYLKEGKIETAFWGGAQWKQMGSVFAWMVSVGLLNKPLYVLSKHLTSIEKDIELPVMYYYNKDTYPQTKEFKDFMSKQMKNWPRDDKGRWLKKK